ncbi:MAG: hypothetical protein JNM39_10005 [Bdellovibrionaceae bacterium]|nr:hypothetical protein [Pseudobdellovibrionaceae bacterium]
MAKIHWTQEAYSNLAQAISFAEANHPKNWTEKLKSTVRELQEKTERNEIVPRRKGRVAGIEEIDFVPLPFLLVVRETTVGDFEFIALLHKSRKYP